MSALMHNRLNKLQELQNFHETHQRLTKVFKVLSLVLIMLAWLLTLFFGFSLPFFVLHSFGTSIWLYNYLSTNHNLKTKWDYLSDPMLWFLLILTVICVIYVLISASHCTLSKY